MSRLVNLRLQIIGNVQRIKDATNQFETRIKGTVVENWVKYWKTVYNDYREVARDVKTNVTEKPFKAAVIMSGLGFLVASAKTNPSLTDFRDQYLKWSNRMILVHPNVQNSEALEHLRFTEMCHNQLQIRRLNLIIGSIIWRDDSSSSTKSYDANCPYLQVQYSKFMDRILDVGFFNTWWVLEAICKLKRCDPEKGHVLMSASQIWRYTTGKATFNIIVVQIDKNNDGYIDLKELKEALDICGFKLPGWKIRQMEEEFNNTKGSMADGKLSYTEFEVLCGDLKSSEVASTFKQVVQKRENLQHLGGTSEASNEGTTHSVRVEEQLAFSEWINSNLRNDADLKHLLPIDPDGKSLYDKVKDGILLWVYNANHTKADTDLEDYKKGLDVMETRYLVNYQRCLQNSIMSDLFWNLTNDIRKIILLENIQSAASLRRKLKGSHRFLLVRLSSNKKTRKRDFPRNRIVRCRRFVDEQRKWKIYQNKGRLI